MLTVIQPEEKNKVDGFNKVDGIKICESRIGSFLPPVEVVKIGLCKSQEYWWQKEI